MIFKKILNCFFSKFQFQNWNFQNWNLGNMWTQNTQTHPPTSPTQHTNTPTNPPKIKTLITHKHTTHNPQTHNTQHTTQTLLWLYNRTQNIYCYECRRVTHSLDSQIIKKKKKKKEVRQSANQILTHSLTHTSTLKKKKKRC